MKSVNLQMPLGFCRHRLYSRLSSSPAPELSTLLLLSRSSSPTRRKSDFPLSFSPRQLFGFHCRRWVGARGTGTRSCPRSLSPRTTSHDPCTALLLLLLLLLLPVRILRLLRRLRVRLHRRRRLLQEEEEEEGDNPAVRSRGCSRLALSGRRPTTGWGRRGDGRTEGDEGGRVRSGSRQSRRRRLVYAQVALAAAANWPLKRPPDAAEPAQEKDSLVSAAAGVVGIAAMQPPSQVDAWHQQTAAEQQ